MKTAIRRPSPVLTLASLALATLTLTASSAHAAVSYVHESFPEFEAQLKAGQIGEATINKRVRSVRVLLTDGRHVLVKYAPKEEGHVARELRAHHVTVSVLTPTQAKTEASKAPVHHKLRYIAGGIVIAVVVIVGGVLLYNRRKRAAQDY
jgi:hypothetical protein